jgi:hypothetical protein
LATCSGICDDLLGLLAGSVEYLLGFTLSVSDRLVRGLLCELEDLGRRVQVFSFAASESWHDLASYPDGRLSWVRFSSAASTSGGYPWPADICGFCAIGRKLLDGPVCPRMAAGERWCRGGGQRAAPAARQREDERR